MAYTGTTPQVWIRLCETAPVPPGPATDCAWAQVYRSVLDIPEFDLFQLESIVAAVIMLVVLLFIIGICKKAIEQ